MRQCRPDTKQERINQTALPLRGSERAWRVLRRGFSTEFLKEHCRGIWERLLSGWRVAEHLLSAKGTEVHGHELGVEEEE